MTKKFLFAEPRDAEGAAIEFTLDPFAPQHSAKQSGGECAAQMRPAFAPIQASKGKSPPQRAGESNVNAEGLKSLLACGRNLICAIRSAHVRRKPVLCHEAIVQSHSKFARHVIVAS